MRGHDLHTRGAVGAAVNAGVPPGELLPPVQTSWSRSINDL